jgi:UDP-glucose:(heptosyl)LPS alpha-1,3-glucosyltransferase
MKIGIVVEHLDPARGGAEHWTWQFVRWLADAGHEPHVVARSFSTESEAIGVTPHPVRPDQSRLGFAEAAEATLRKLKLDVIHDMGCGWHCDVLQPHGGARGAASQQNLLLTPAWLRPIKSRWARHLPRYREFTELTRRQYADAGRLVIALSKMVAADLVTFHGVKSAQIRQIYNGVDTERFSPARRDADRTKIRAELDIHPDEVLFLIVAHNFALKGVPTLLRALGTLAWEGKPVRLVIAGGKRLGAAARIARQAGIRQRTTFLGAIPDAAPYYAAADAYVQPTYYDPCSLVVLEALAAGLPVITSRFNGAGELITPGLDGAVIDDPGNAAELANRLREFCDPVLRHRMGTAARRLALGHTWDQNCRQIVELYAEVTARRSSHPRMAA